MNAPELIDYVLGPLGTLALQAAPAEWINYVLGPFGALVVCVIVAVQLWRENRALRGEAPSGTREAP